MDTKIEWATPKYPDIEVQLSGEDGNVFPILARMQIALRAAGIRAEERAEFMQEATSGDYDHVLQTCVAWVTVL